MTSNQSRRPMNMSNTSIERMIKRPRVLESCQTTLWNPISDSQPYYSRRNRSQSHHLWWKTDQTLFTTCSNWKPSAESLRKLSIRSIWALGARNSLHRAISWTETLLRARQALLIWLVSEKQRALIPGSTSNSIECSRLERDRYWWQGATILI